MRKIAILIFAFTLRLAAQTDTSSFFPLGLWGIWIDGSAPPRSGATIPAPQWDQETSNWQGMPANYLVALIPRSIEDTVMQITQPLGYRMDIAADSLIGPTAPDTSLRTWIMTAPDPLTNSWKSRVDDKVIGIRNKFGSRALHSYFLMHESDLRGGSSSNDSSTWTAFGYVVDRIKYLDSLHKSYVVYNTHCDIGAFPFGITAAQFANRFPKLGIFQVDDYEFLSGSDTTYTWQQPRLDSLLITSYNPCMVAFRNGSTEWHAVIQTQRDENLAADSGCRRPSLYRSESAGIPGSFTRSEGHNIICVWF